MKTIWICMAILVRILEKDWLRNMALLVRNLHLIGFQSVITYWNWIKYWISTWQWQNNDPPCLHPTMWPRFCIWAGCIGWRWRHVSLSHCPDMTHFILASSWLHLPPTGRWQAPWTRTPTPPPEQYLADISCQELWNENFTHLNLILYSFFAFIQVWLQQPSDSLTPVD